MKRIILASIVAMSFFAAEAQTKSKSKKSKKTTVTTASKAKAREKAEIARIQKETDQKILDYKTTSFLADSMRVDSERVARINFEAERKAYLETRLKEIDSTNKATWKRFSEEKEISSKSDHHYDAVNKAANLSAYEGRQVKFINQSYNEKARAIRLNTEITADQQKEQLVALNTERRNKIQVTVGKSKAKRIEKERKEYVKKYGEDGQAKWIDEVEGMAKNK